MAAKYTEHDGEIVPDSYLTYSFAELGRLVDRARTRPGFMPIEMPQATAVTPPEEIIKDEPEVQAPKPLEENDETAETIRTYIRLIRAVGNGEISPSDPDAKYLKDLHDDFRREGLRHLRNSNVVTALLDDDVSNPDLEKGLVVSPGLSLIVSRQSRRGENLTGAAVNPNDMVPTLAIRFYQKRQELAGKNKVTEWKGVQLLQGCAIARLIQNLYTERANQPFIDALQKRGIVQVRLEVYSYRERAGEKYSVAAPLFGAFVPEQPKK